jgi:hypothetical protein
MLKNYKKTSQNVKGTDKVFGKQTLATLRPQILDPLNPVPLFYG